MTVVEAAVECPVFDSFRVQQVAGMFDVRLSEKAAERFRVDVPPMDAPWQIGLICGPSGSGKSTIARRLFGDRVWRAADWPLDRAVIDCIGEGSFREAVGLLIAVGFSSPPSWIKPYRALSTGEQFRCDLARALAAGVGEGSLTANALAAAALAAADRCEVPDDSPLSEAQDAAQPLVVFDEFTSVVDRNVARVASAAIAKAIRTGRIARRFVAVTCHYDVAQWLQPDWILDMAGATFFHMVDDPAAAEMSFPGNPAASPAGTDGAVPAPQRRRRLRRPPIDLAIVRCRRSAWRLFARHHYLTGALNPRSRCFLALWRDEPVAFCATLPVIGRRAHWRVTRIVTLPDYQGMGIGGAVLEAVAQLHRLEGHRVNLTASHPAVVGHCRTSPQWRAVGVRKVGSPSAECFPGEYRGSLGRAVASFEYVGPRG